MHVCARVLAVVVAVCAMSMGARATAINVYGFCQTGHGAMFQGGWGSDAASSKCYRGMFGVPAADGSIFDSTSVTCTLPNMDATTGDSPLCSCLGVPQVCACDGVCGCVSVAVRVGA